MCVYTADMLHEYLPLPPKYGWGGVVCFRNFCRDRPDPVMTYAALHRQKDSFPK